MLSMNRTGNITLPVSTDINATEIPTYSTPDYQTNTTNASCVLTNTELFVAEILFNKILKLLITVVGVVGNGLIIVILTKQKNRHSSTSIYLTALAISDMLVLIFGPLSHWLITTWNIDISKYGTIECKIIAFMQSTSVSISSWLLVAVTMERVICVTSPYHVKTYCTHKLAIIFIFVIWLMIYAADTHFIWGMGHKYDDHCDALTEKYQHFSNYVLPWIDFWMAFGFPVLFLGIGNIIIIRQITITRIQRNRMTYSSSMSNFSVTPILISATVFFILTMAPFYVLSVRMPHWITNSDECFLLQIKKFWNPILRVVWESNAALNFVLYFLTGSKFRLEVKTILSCSCRKYSYRAGVFDPPINTELELQM